MRTLIVLCAVAIFFSITTIDIRKTYAENVRLHCNGRFQLLAELDPEKEIVVLRYPGNVDTYENGRVYIPEWNFKAQATDEVVVTQDRIYFKSRWVCTEPQGRGNCPRGSVMIYGGYFDRFTGMLVKEETDRFQCNVITGPKF